MNRILNILSILFLFLVTIAFSIKSLREPDLWWQIRTGEWILQYFTVPVSDIFSYTMHGTPWLNIKWGSEVLFALITKLSGPETIFLLQAVISVLLLYFLIRMTKLFDEIHYDKNIRIISLSITSLVTLICIEYRMIGRPEMFSHLFTVIFLYLLLDFRFNNSKWIFLIIPAQMLWANMHEAFGIGIVMTAFFVFVQWLEYIMIKANQTKECRRKSVRLSIIWLASIFSVIINPNGINLLLRPINIMSQVYQNKYTTELLNFTEHDYWNKEAYLALFLFLISFFYIVYVFFYKSKRSYKLFSNNIDPGYLLVVLAFLYLALTAFRNIVFLVLAIFPIFYYILYKYISKLTMKSAYLPGVLRVTSVFSYMTLYILIVSNTYYKITNSRDKFGLEILAPHNPTGAADYIEQNGLKNKRCFSDYLTSSYLLWKLQPDFKTFIDLRDLDVFPPEFIDNFINIANNPPLFYSYDSFYNFDYVVLYRPQFSQLHSYLFNDSIYALKYVDAVAAVYAKTDDFTRDDIFSNLKPIKASSVATAVNHILNPFYKKYDYSSVNNNEFASVYYSSVLQFHLARLRANKCLQNKKEKYKGYYLIGQISLDEYNREKTEEKKKQLLNEAENYLNESYFLNKYFAPTLSSLGNVQLLKGNFISALNYYKKSLSINETDATVHVLAAEACKTLAGGNAGSQYSTQEIEYLKSALYYNPGNPYLETELGLAYCNYGDCRNAKKYLNKTTIEKRLSQKQRQQVQKCIQECE